jgi:hypothetical protein
MWPRLLTLKEARSDGLVRIHTERKVKSIYGLSSAKLLNSFWTFHGGTAIQGKIRLRYVKKNLEQGRLHVYVNVEAFIEKDQERKWKCFRVSCEWVLRKGPLLLQEAASEDCEQSQLIKPQTSNRGPRQVSYGDEYSLFALYIDVGCE